MAHGWHTGCWNETLFIALFFAAQAQAQTVERPNIQVGDSWKYETKDLLTNLVASQTVRIITAVSDSQIEGTENGDPARYTSDMNPVETPEFRFDPAASSFHFPFRQGDKWSHDGKYLNKATGMVLRNKYVVSVVGQERISVPVGTYETYKLVQEGYFTSNPGITSSRTTPFTRTYWYAPGVKAVVRSEIVAGPNRTVVELIETNIKP